MVATEREPFFIRLSTISGTTQWASSAVVAVVATTIFILIDDNPFDQSPEETGALIGFIFGLGTMLAIVGPLFYSSASQNAALRNTQRLDLFFRFCDRIAEVDRLIGRPVKVPLSEAQKEAIVRWRFLKFSDLNVPLDIENCRKDVFEFTHALSRRIRMGRPYVREIVVLLWDCLRTLEQLHINSAARLFHRSDHLDSVLSALWCVAGLIIIGVVAYVSDSAMLAAVCVLLTMFIAAYSLFLVCQMAWHVTWEGRNTFPFKV
jgi:hypothetical protein